MMENKKQEIKENKKYEDQNDIAEGMSLGMCLGVAIGSFAGTMKKRNLTKM